MKKKLALLITACFIMGSASAFAQDKKFEAYGRLGYALSEGVDVSPREEDNLGIRRLSPKSAVSYGLGLDYFVTENLSLGFSFGQENSKLRASVRALEGVDITDLNVNNYHAVVTYNFGDPDRQLRPFVFAGLGATNYSPSAIDGYDIEGSTKLSTTWGAGVKYFTTERVGFRAGIRWTPTYFDVESGGIWCSQYWTWNCWAVENSNHSHQFELSAGIVVRF